LVSKNIYAFFLPYFLCFVLICFYRLEEDIYPIAIKEKQKIDALIEASHNYLKEENAWGLKSRKEWNQIKDLDEIQLEELENDDL